jgi:hypothetical protein
VDRQAISALTQSIATIAYKQKNNSYNNKQQQQQQQKASRKCYTHLASINKRREERVNGDRQATSTPPILLKRASYIIISYHDPYYPHQPAPGGNSQPTYIV